MTARSIPDLLTARCRSAFAAHRRRAKAVWQELDYDAGDLVRLARANPVCTYCRNLLTPEGLAFDHAVPTSRYADYRLANLTVVCGRCNSLKGLLRAEEFRQLQALLTSWPPAAANDVTRRLLAGGRRYRGR